MAMHMLKSPSSAQVGLDVGPIVGFRVGLELGTSVGFFVGSEVGLSDGFRVGCNVGLWRDARKRTNDVLCHRLKR